jgi:histidyl-tRNA synthetase
MNPDLRLPFKRYQLQPVWRAERAQRGRFREFWQCDVDIVGAPAPLADAECLAVAASSLKELGFPDYVLRVSDRRILADLAKYCGASTPSEEASFVIAVDKLDKLGHEGAEAEIRQRVANPQNLGPALWQALDAKEDTDSALDRIGALCGERGAAGIATLRALIPTAVALGTPAERLRFDPSLARGSDYYTGPVFEANLPELTSSVAGGGRYDELIGMFSGRQIPCVGISLGLERLLVIMEERGMQLGSALSARVLVAVYDPAAPGPSLDTVRALRAAGVDSDLFLGDQKLKGQFKYADARGYPWLILIGPEEQAAGVVTLKDLRSGTQDRIPLDAAVERLRLA